MGPQQENTCDGCSVGLEQSLIVQVIFNKGEQEQ